MFEPLYYVPFIVLLALSFIGGVVVICVYVKKKSAENRCATPICKDDAICKALEPLMVDLMVKKLKFEDEKTEFEAVKKHLIKMKDDVHYSGGKTNNFLRVNFINSTLWQYRL
jgi:hypothetical protein